MNFVGLTGPLPRDPTSGALLIQPPSPVTRALTVAPDSAGPALIVVGNNSDGVQAKDAAGHKLVTLSATATGATDFGGAINLFGKNGLGTDKLAWNVGIDTAAATPYRDFFIAKVEGDGTTTSGVTDVFYLSHNGASAAKVGIGLVPPTWAYRLQVAGQDTELAMGGIGIRVNAAMTGKPLGFVSSADGLDKLWFDRDYYLSADKANAAKAVAIKATDELYATGRRTLVLADNDGTAQYGFQHDSGGVIKFRSFTGGVTIAQFAAATTTWVNRLDMSNATALQLAHAAAATPTGGSSGDIKLGNGKIWVNDAGTWKSVAVA